MNDDYRSLSMSDNIAEKKNKQTWFFVSADCMRKQTILKLEFKNEHIITATFSIKYF